MSASAVQPGRASFDSLRREAGRVFPAGSREAELLARPLAELERMLEAGESVETIEPVLEGLEDLLEALLNSAGWPDPHAAGERGRTS